MPNIKSAKKRMKTSARRAEANKPVKALVSSTQRKLSDAAAGGNKSLCDELFPKYCSVLDKAVKKGVLKANAADRRKSRMAARLTAVSA